MLTTITLAGELDNYNVSEDDVKTIQLKPIHLGRSFDKKPTFPFHEISSPLNVELTLIGVF